MFTRYLIIRDTNFPDNLYKVEICKKKKSEDNFIANRKFTSSYNIKC